jgi:hypothetical protein
MVNSEKFRAKSQFPHRINRLADPDLALPRLMHYSVLQDQLAASLFQGA